MKLPDKFPQVETRGNLLGFQDKRVSQDFPDALENLSLFILMGFAVILL